MANIETSPITKGVLVRINGRIDALSAPELEKVFLEQIAAGNTLLVVDVAAMDYISSAGLRSFLLAYKQVKPKQGRILLCGAAKLVLEVFETTGLHQVFEFFPSVDAAEQTC